MNLAVGEKKVCCLRTCWGSFLSARNGGGSTVTGMTFHCREWEKFIVWRINKTQFVIITSNGHYFCAENGGGRGIEADRSEVGAWEKFTVVLNENGTISLRSHNGPYLSCNPQGVLTFDKDHHLQWESFELCEYHPSSQITTQIIVNVYQIVAGPIWHSGIVINGVEYFYQVNSRVEDTSPRGMKKPLKFHREMIRDVPGSLYRVLTIFEKVRSEWNRKTYDLFNQNCNYFVDDVLRHFGFSLDKEYLRCSGLATLGDVVVGRKTRAIIGKLLK